MLERLRALSLLTLAIAAVPAPCAAQRGGFFGRPMPESAATAPYDGRFTFARLKFSTLPGGYYYMGLPAWEHGYAKAEKHLLRIVNEVSSVKVHLDVSNVLALDDPALMKFPVAYMAEPDYWGMNDKEALALRAYLEKGGFIIFDDFRDDGRNGYAGWANFVAQMKRVVPALRIVDLQPSHPIFHSFFEINSFAIIPQRYDPGPPVLRGIFDGNDPKRRLIAIINFNTDVSDFWEFSGQGFQLVSEENEAYKLGVNYLVYALTH